MGHTFAVVGATSLVGREIISMIAERDIKVDEMVALAPRRDAGKSLSFGDKTIKVTAVEDFNFAGVDIVFMACDAALAAGVIPSATAKGARVIDLSGHTTAPLLIPNAVKNIDVGQNAVVAAPHPMTTQLATVLLPLQDYAPISRVVVSTYQAVSGTGREAMDELFGQTRGVFMNAELKPEHFPKQLAFNVLPHTDAFRDEDRMTQTEARVTREVGDIVGLAGKICINAAVVPVFIGHGAMVNVTFEKGVTAAQAKSVWLKARGVSLIDLESDLEYVTPSEVQGEDAVFVSRVREDASADHALNFWCVADNIRSGSALNAVLLAERMTIS
ncbi:MAG: aspartate-semialdehyde dehydrogenase [Pseudomonadota bacterium]